MHNARTAILVAGHSIVRDWTRLESDEGWFLLDFQRGEATRYIEHARRGVELAAADPAALLLFTGGQSRAAAGPRTGGYPEHVTLVGWEFKRERFHLHREAIRWPQSRFHYDGPNNPPDLEPAVAAEARARDRYRVDPYSASAEFQAKRAERNPFRRQHGYFTSCPELAPLFQHPGPEAFRGPLPWE